MNYELPKLDYPYNALEPYIDARTMEIHHTKHHQTYLSNLKKALEDANYAAPATVEELISDLSRVPESIRTSVRNNGGGHANHSFFWKILSPKGGGKPVGGLAQAIDKSFGNFDSFKEAFSKAAALRFGSGWAWLCLKDDNSLATCSTANQDNPRMKGFADCVGKPIIGLDVWEHSYYLLYQNRRADYIAAFWNVVNWEQAEKNYQAALGK